MPLFLEQKLFGSGSHAIGSQLPTFDSVFMRNDDGWNSFDVDKANTVQRIVEIDAA